MGKIRLERMQFYAYHGHYPEEKVAGTKFEIDLTLETSLKKAGISDELTDTLNYQEAYAIVREVMGNSYNLLEHIAHHILTKLKDQFSELETACVKISKMNPPMGGQMRCVSVEMKLNEI
ncbi:MAG: dihydroneopterin aldolase [Bacteroidetes bacterium]|jgi:dihydroneopterin aldolase|nr:dihydroneopterin aldolase [Bacteroidota bacterium]